MVAKVNEVFQELKGLFSHLAEGDHGLEALPRSLLHGEEGKLSGNSHVDHSPGNPDNLASGGLGL